MRSVVVNPSLLKSMAKTLSMPWILSSISEILSSEISTNNMSNSRHPPSTSSSSFVPESKTPSSTSTGPNSSTLSYFPARRRQITYPISRPPKSVQVIRVYVEERILIVNDQSHTIAVFPSSSCLQEIANEYGFSSVASLQNSVIRLDSWHFSTVIQCLHQRSFESLTKIGITLPLAVNCSKISNVGAFDCNPIGSLVDINKDPQVREELSKISYVILVQKLISCQFIDQGQLPNANGEFVLPPLYSSTTSADCTATNSYAPALNHCKISRDQLIKLGLESQIATEGGDTQVYESQNGTERDFIVTQTEVDQSFDFDMELRTPSQGEENSYPTSTKCGKTYQPTSTFRSPPIVPSFTSLLATINQSIDQNGLTTQLNFDSSLEMTKEDDQDGYSLSQRNFFTQNMTQESLLEMEKWLLTSSQTDNPARNLPPNPQELQSQVKQEGEEYDVSSDEEPPLINHYPLSANPKFVHSEAPQQDVTVPKENPNALNSLTISEPSPDDESQTQPQILYTETDGTQSAVLREYTSVYIPDTLTSSWDTPPDIPAAMPQVSSSPSHDGFIGKKFHKTFPGVGTYCGCVSEYNRPYYTIIYEDGTTEQLEESTVRFWMERTNRESTLHEERVLSDLVISKQFNVEDNMDDSLDIEKIPTNHGKCSSSVAAPNSSNQHSEELKNKRKLLSQSSEVSTPERLKLPKIETFTSRTHTHTRGSSSSSSSLHENSSSTVASPAVRFIDENAPLSARAALLALLGKY